MFWKDNDKLVGFKFLVFDQAFLVIVVFLREEFLNLNLDKIFKK